MNKPYLLIMGDCYYTRDWKKCFASQEEALKAVEEVLYEDHFGKGPRKGQVKSSYHKYRYKLEESEYLKNSEYDWYEIVDLEEWVK